MSRIIGFDPGLAATGFGVIDSDGSRIVHIGHGVIRTESSQNMGERLRIIANELRKVLSEFGPVAAAVETLYFAKNIKSAIPVAQVRGVILCSIAEYGIECGEYTPLVVKQAVVGRGRAEKRQVQAMLRIILGLDDVPSPDHAADALAVAFCHATCARFVDNYAGGR
jgi:crossover junction endodeoxyribonuclease RuvC